MPAQPTHPEPIESLRAAIARLERGHAAAQDVLPFGVEAIDAALPGGGLGVGALHEVVGAGIDVEFAAAPALFAAGILARRAGPVVWVLARPDLFAPALAAAGLHPARVIHVEAGKQGLLAMEEALRHPGLAGVVAEVTAPVSLTASRRLHLAAQAGGAIALMLRRQMGARTVDGAMAASTRWRIGPMPSAPPLPHAPDTPGLGRLRWQLELTRCRGGQVGSWVVEACDAQGRLDLVSALADGSAATPREHLGFRAVA